MNTFTSLTLTALLLVIAMATCLAGLGQFESRAAELTWVEPFEAAKQEAKQAAKPMLVFIGDMSACKDCQAFTSSICTQPELLDFAARTLICTRVIYNKKDSQDERWKKSRIVESFNIPNAHAVIIANAEG